MDIVDMNSFRHPENVKILKTSIQKHLLYQVLLPNAEAQEKWFYNIINKFDNIIGTSSTLYEHNMKTIKYMVEDLREIKKNRYECQNLSISGDVVGRNTLLQFPPQEHFPPKENWREDVNNRFEERLNEYKDTKNYNLKMSSPMVFNDLIDSPILDLNERLEMHKKKREIILGHETSHEFKTPKIKIHSDVIDVIEYGDETTTREKTGGDSRIIFSSFPERSEGQTILDCKRNVHWEDYSTRLMLLEERINRVELAIESLTST
jgi:hypothetical protein